MVIGVISDTHGLLREEVQQHFAGVERIIHAGDLDDGDTLRRLSAIAPVTSVRGNCDRGTWARDLRDVEMLRCEGHTICVVHDLAGLGLEPEAAGISTIVFGHTHGPHNQTKDGILYFNPGSAGPARSGKPITIGKLYVGPEGIRGVIIALAS